jgi:ribonuclease P protein component
LNASSSPHPLPLHKRRLNKPYMYKKVFEGGRALRSAPLTLRYLHVDPEHSRLGFIIRKKVGNACMRNSIRRTLRHCFQAALPTLSEGTWLVFDVSDKASQCRRAELQAQAETFLRSLGSLAVPGLQAAPGATPSSGAKT